MGRVRLPHRQRRPGPGLPFTAAKACPDGPCRGPARCGRRPSTSSHTSTWLRPCTGLPSYDVPQSLERVEEFLASHDLTWRDTGLSWGQQGNQRAAETIAWGLMDQRYTVDPDSAPSPAPSSRPTSRS